MPGLNLRQVYDALDIPKLGKLLSTPGFNPDASAPPPTELLVAEAAQKISSAGSSSNFTKLTGSTEISNGQLRDSTTKQRIADLDRPKEIAPAGTPIDVEPANTNSMKVTISQYPENETGLVLVLDVMPTIQESGGASYSQSEIIHHPGEILKYKTTNSRSWSVSGRLVSRNSAEASKNLKIVNMIRSWRMPYYGTGTAKTDGKILGAPPPILTLSAYGISVIGPTKCVLESYDWTWPNDVDYLPAAGLEAGAQVAFPAIIDVSLSLKETWSPSEYSSFSIRDYRMGNLGKSFSRS